ncbi:alpha/beta hydrolase [Saccharopolyspora sp. K220]|uniref:alpha/beta fold hydrolase n=1 Tax=Saccharopolyspora soli TaxID=2926618 RepID=UPI001F59BE9C|nr:alpha/beta hydrolase [Saccharopolyspora soli]MCI2421438.1 alpha/beta hydrolase [Saccharopolyspora soli]
MTRRDTVPNYDGERQIVGTTEVTHHFQEAPGAVAPIRWHYVTAGNPHAEPIVFLHGNPESWRAWEPQIDHFAKTHHVIAVDLKGYGQSDKSPGDWRWENCAAELLALLDQLGLRTFAIVSHDRGTVLADYLGGNHPDRVHCYVRMQQVCHVWRPEYSWQAEYFADPLFGPYLFGDPDVYFDFRLKAMLKNEVDEHRLETLRYEMSYPGIADAVVRYYQASSFEKERIDRVRLFPHMNFPVLLLQGNRDDGQPTYYFDHPKLPATLCFPSAELQWVDGAGHYTNLEKPEIVTEAVANFLATHQTPTPGRSGMPWGGTNSDGTGRQHAHVV